MLIDAMNEFERAQHSLKDWREKRLELTSDHGSVIYENSLINKVREAYKKIEELADFYKIELTQEVKLPRPVGFKNNIGPNLNSLGR